MEKQHYPVNMTRLLQNARQMYNLHEGRSDVKPNEVLKAYRELVKRLEVVPGIDQVSSEAQSNAVFLFLGHHVQNKTCNVGLIVCITPPQTISFGESLVNDEKKGIEKFFLFFNGRDSLKAQ